MKYFLVIKITLGEAIGIVVEAEDHNSANNKVSSIFKDCSGMYHTFEIPEKEFSDYTYSPTSSRKKSFSPLVDCYYAFSTCLNVTSQLKK